MEPRRTGPGCSGRAGAKPCGGAPQPVPPGADAQDGAFTGRRRRRWPAPVHRGPPISTRPAKGNSSPLSLGQQYTAFQIHCSGRSRPPTAQRDEKEAVPEGIRSSARSSTMHIPCREQRPEQIEA